VTGPEVVVAGEALVDLVLPATGEPEAAPGGSPLNVAVGLSRLGLRTLLVSELGDDEHGAQLRHHLEASGVSLHEESVVAGARTSTAAARLDATGAATYKFDLSWTLGPRTLPPGARCLHVGSLGTALRPGREHVLDLVQQADRAGALVTFDPNARPVLTPDPARAWADVREVAAFARVVKVSDEDLHFLQPGASPGDLADELLAGSTQLVVVTAGGSGATAFSGEASVDVGSRPTHVVDTVGAGDSFMAALVAVVLEHGLGGLTEERLRAYVEAAHQVAAVTVSRRGADPPTRAELPAGWPHVPPPASGAPH
jgi:fructokinase